MPLITITHSNVSSAVLQQLAEQLPRIVSEALDCPEEPYDGNLQPGDVDIRFRERSDYDTGGLPLVIEVYSKLFESRAQNRQERSDMIYDQLLSIVRPTTFGVYLAFPIAAWSQDD